MNLFFDTETTGKANFKSSPAAPGQPRLVQLGAILCDSTMRVVGEINVIIKPEGFTIPKEASDIHGITDELAQKYGIKLTTALGMFRVFMERAETLIAHNYDFDRFLLVGEYLRNDMIEIADKLKASKNFCTMKATTDICKIPGPYGNKWPKLQEAYKFFFNEEFEGAHDAMADIRACKRVYYHLLSEGAKKS